ncbi:MAG: DNA damage-inducible protein 1 [Chrysothrix sp. TS-e1954]|nr:MAG: DNA damage-inducible protein 1 [Chrysothrix sp. TS-e1954]
MASPIMIHITVSVLRTEQLLSYEVASTTTIADLKSFVQAETEEDQTLHLNGAIISDTSRTVSDAGIKDNDLIVAKPASQPAPAPAQPTQPTPTAAPSGSTPNPTEIEAVRQRFLSEPSTHAELRQRAPELFAALNDSTRFAQLFAQLEGSRRAQAAELQRLNEDINPENQEKVLEMIRRENLEREMDVVMRDHPELLTRVTMLYISLTVNGHPVKAFVDSGAQATILSPSCAETCGITHLIDDRWSGVAHGVGTAKILGRIHRANVKIGWDELPCAFTVMEGKDVDMLLGLDMLKRYQACIDLNKNCLTFPGGQSVDFLPESEIPTFGIEQEAVVQGPGGTEIGAQSGALKPAGGSQAAGSGKQPATSAFSGSSRTLGGAPPSSSSTPAQHPPAPAQASQQAQPAPPQRPTAPTPASANLDFPEASISTLQGIGATREQAVEALRACGGNVDAAASLLFDI